jgi:peptidoglycan/LPS O-acetylase OafA/YrhL
VIIFHASSRALPNGYLGVDIFFVISGYVVSPMILRIFEKDTARSIFQLSKYELRQFFQKRFLRLAPALGATLVISAIVALIYLPPRDLGRFAGQGLATLSLLGNFGAYHYVGDYFHPNPNPLVHTWSLSTEEQIYLLIPLLLFLIFKLKNLRLEPHKVLGMVYFCLGLLSFVFFTAVGLLAQYTEGVPANLTNFSFYSLAGRFWQFAIGGALFLYFNIIKKNTFGGSGFLKFVSIIGILVVLGWRSPLNSPYGEFMACVAAGLFIALNNSIFQKPQKFFAWFGDRSYSLYLIHMPLMYLAFFSPRWSDGYNRRSGKLVALALTFVVGVLIYELVEKKFRVRGRTTPIPSTAIRNTSLLFVLAPFIIMISIFVGSSGNFFGLDKNVRGPIDPGSLDTVCYSQLGAFPCIYGDSTSDKKVALLVGDSHARHLTIGFIEAAKSSGFTPVIWTQSGCQFVLRNTAKNFNWQKMDGAWGTRQHAEKQSCFEHNDQIINWVYKHPNAAVFVTQRSTSYPGKDFGVDPKTYLRAMSGDIHKLKLKGNKVTVIGPNPEFPDFTKFFAGNTLLWEKSYEDTAPRTLKMEEMIQNPFTDDLRLKYETAKLDLKYISIIKLFCSTEGLCSRYQNGSWLYANGDHLSIEGSRMIKPEIIKILQE